MDASNPRRLAEILPSGGKDPDPQFGARRRHRRWPLNAEVEILEPVQTRGFTINASVGGLRVAVEDALPKGGTWRARISTSERYSYIEAGEVVWVAPKPGGYVAGLAFS